MLTFVRQSAMGSVLLVWFFTWLYVAPSGATIMGASERFASATDCWQEREGVITALAALYTAGQATGWEVHACDHLDRMPR